MLKTALVLMRQDRSRPARGAWVEILRSTSEASAMSRAPQGARGLKCAGFELDQQTKHVAPRKGRVG